MPKRVAVFAGQTELAERVREACPEWEVADGADPTDCEVAIVDAGTERPAVAPSVVLVLLGDGDGLPEPDRSACELRLPRAEFLRSPGGYLTFAAEAAEAVARAAQLELETAYLRQIHELMTMVDAEAVSERITRTLLEITGLATGTLFLHDPRLERYVVSYNNDPGHRETDEIIPGVSPAVLQQAIASPDLYAVARNEDGSGMIAMPLRVEEDLLGVVRVPLRAGEDLDARVGTGVTRYLKAVGQVVSNVYQLTRSRDLAMRDDLTKAYNRRFFDTYLDEEIERSRRYGTLLSIIFLDLDDLKSINNLYGHLSGSRTLQEVAKRILSAVRGIDKVVRFGGDEFCVILPQTDQEQAVAVANRISRAIASSKLHIDGSIEVSITASFGIATYPTHEITKEGLIRQADAAMYRVKSTTKNAVGVAAVGP